MEFRSVQPETDALQIAEIYNYYITDTTVSFETEPVDASVMKERISKISKQFPFFVCENDGQILGYCYAHLWKERQAYSRTLETTIYLAPEAKRQGLGTRLMKKLIEECKRLGYTSLIACITAENRQSCDFHESLGFSKVSHFQKVGYKFNRFLDVVDYQLLLSD